MDDQLQLLLTLQLRALGYEAFDAVAAAFQNLGGIIGAFHVVSGAATLDFDLMKQGAAELVGVLEATAVLGGAAAAAIGAGFIMATEQAGQFSTMTTEVANNANMTNQQLATMQSGVLDLAKNTGASTDQIAQGWMHVADEGYQGADAYKVMTAATESAVSTGASVASTANLLGTVLHDWHLNGDQAASTMDSLHTASALSNVTLDQFTKGMQSLAPAASMFGISLDESSAALATMTRYGYSATQAGTQFRNLLTHIADPTSGAEKAVEALGQKTGVDLVNDFSQAGLATKGFTGVLKDIATATGGDINAFADLTGQQRVSADQATLVKEALNGNTKAMQDMIPATRGLFGMYILTSSGAKDYVGILDKLNQSHLDGGITAQNFQRYLDTLGAQMQLLKSNVQVAAIELGNDFMPIAKAAVGWLIDTAIPWFQVLSQALGGAVVSGIRAAGEEWQKLVAVFQNNGIVDALGTLLQDVWSFVSGFFQAGVNLVEQLAQGMWNAASTILEEVVNEIATFIASFFVGNSPPPAGPLNKIDEGGKNTMAAWTDGAKQGLGGLQAVADSASTTLAAIPNKANATGLANDYNQAKVAVLGMKDAAADAKDALVGVEQQLTTVTGEYNYQSDILKGMKQTEQDELQPLQDKLTALQNQTDTLYQQQQITDNIQQASIDAAKYAAEGDPVKRAALEGQLEAVKSKEQELSTDAQIANVQQQIADAKGKAGSGTQLQALQAKLQELDIQKQIYGLQNLPALASATTQEQALKEKEAQEKIANEKWKADHDAQVQQQKTAIDAVKQKYEAQLKTQTDLVSSLNVQKQTLEQQKSVMTENNQLASDAITKAGDLASKLGVAASAAKGIGGGLKGGGFPPPAPINFGNPGDGGVPKGIGEDLQRKMEAMVADGVSKAQEGARKAAEAFVGNFQSGIQAHLAQWQNSATNFAQSGWKSVVATFNGFQNDLGGKLGQLGAFLGPRIQAGLQQATAALGQFDQWVEPRLGAAFNALGTWARIQLVALLSKFDFRQALAVATQPDLGFGGMITAAFTVAQGVVGTAVNNFFKWLDQQLSTAVGVNVHFFEALQGILGSIGDAINLLKPLFGFLVDDFKVLAVVTGAVTLALGEVVYWFQQNKMAADALKVVVVIVGLAIAAAFFPVPLIIAGVVLAFTAIVEVFNHQKEILDWIGPYWRTVWDSIKQLVQAFWDFVKDTFILYIDVVKGLVQVFLDVINGNWSKAASDLLNLIGKLWSDMIKIFSDQGKAVEAVLSGILNLLFGAVSGFAPNFAQAGHDLVQGMINGINGMAAAAVGAVQHVVGDAVNAAKTALGIKSPSTVFHEIGQNVGLGLIGGMQSMYSAAASAGASLANSTVPGGLAHSGSGNGGAAVVININNPQVWSTNDVERLADQIGHLFVQQTKQSYRVGRFQ